MTPVWSTVVVAPAALFPALWSHTFHHLSDTRQRQQGEVDRLNLTASDVHCHFHGNNKSGMMNIYRTWACYERYVLPGLVIKSIKAGFSSRREKTHVWIKKDKKMFDISPVLLNTDY